MEIQQKGRQQETISRKSVKGLVIGHEFPCAKQSSSGPPEFPLPDPCSHSRDLPSSVQFSCSIVSDSLRPHGLQHARLPCPSPTPGVYLNSCPLSRWYHPTVSSSVLPFSSCLQSFPASGSFTMSQLFASGGQSIGVSASASVLPMNNQDWLPLGLTGLISLQSKGLEGFSPTLHFKSINSLVLSFL